MSRRGLFAALEDLEGNNVINVGLKPEDEVLVREGEKELNESMDDMMDMVGTMDQSVDYISTLQDVGDSLDKSDGVGINEIAIKPVVIATEALLRKLDYPTHALESISNSKELSVAIEGVVGDAIEGIKKYLDKILKFFGEMYEKFKNFIMKLLRPKAKKLEEEVKECKVDRPSEEYKKGEVSDSDTQTENTSKVVLLSKRSYNVLIQTAFTFGYTAHGLSINFRFTTEITGENIINLVKHIEPYISSREKYIEAEIDADNTGLNDGQFDYKDANASLKEKGRFNSPRITWATKEEIAEILKDFDKITNDIIKYNQYVVTGIKMLRSKLSETKPTNGFNLRAHKIKNLIHFLSYNTKILSALPSALLEYCERSKEALKLTEESEKK